MPGTRLDALAARYWETFLETHPLFATAVGDRRYDDRLADPTDEGVAAVRARLVALLAEVDALDAPDAMRWTPTRRTPTRGRGRRTRWTPEPA